MLNRAEANEWVENTHKLVMAVGVTARAGIESASQRRSVTRKKFEVYPVDMKRN